MKTDLEVEVEVDLRQLGKVLIFRDTHTEPSYYILILCLCCLIYIYVMYNVRMHWGVLQAECVCSVSVADGEMGTHSNRCNAPHTQMKWISPAGQM